ncbi:MAG TPA: sulfatase, partial [Pirellulaceae bacterium]|nr:sulfatase [Pirellulaceae bacterium]
MQRCKFRMWVILGGMLAAWWAKPAGGADDWKRALSERPPNLVVIFVDDLGYGDIRPFGDPPYPTPHLDNLAERGRAFTDFLVPSAVCSASRAALLTGCYPTRVGIEGALGPRSPIGISPQEVTLGELCQSRGYATACIGKWHLGDHRDSLPLQHGFDFYFGLPYSNDMWSLHPDLMRLPPDVRARRQGYPDLPLLRGNEVFNPRVTADDQRQLTTQYTEQAVQFIQRHADQPFLLYVAHSMVHVPLYVSDKFAGRSGSGLFGDCMMEIDWSVGEIVRILEALELTDNTLIWFTSDNGPWLSYGDHAGNAGPLREGKGTSFEGGVRVPTLACWPGRIPAGSYCAELATTMDILPTTAALIGAALPEHTIDGHDIRNLLFGDEQAVSPHTSLAIYY